MTEQVPLAATSSDPFERALLESVRRDQPTSQALQRTAAALGLGATAFASTGTASGVLGGVTSVASLGLYGVALKSVIIGALCGSVAVAGIHMASPAKAPLAGIPKVTLGTASNRPANVDSAQRQPELRATRNSAESPMPGREQPGSSTEPVGARNSNSMAPSRTAEIAERVVGDTQSHLDGIAAASEPSIDRSAKLRHAMDQVAVETAHVAPLATTPSIADEIECIDHARQALREGKARDALGELTRYQARWPSGAFVMESSLLRVEAWLVLGDRSAAERDADVILARHPTGRYAARLRALLGQGER